MINRDLMNSASPEAIAQATLGVIDKASDLNPEVQGPALAMGLLAYARRLGVDVGDFFTVANNVLHSKAVSTPTFNALQLYMQHEVKR